MTKLTVRNGELLDVRFEGRRLTYEGKAGVRKPEGGRPWEVAFTARKSKLAGCEAGTVGDVAVIVLDIADSAWVPGMVVLTVRPTEAADQA